MAADVMTSDLIIARASTVATRAWQAIVAAGVHHLPVMIGERCVGLLTEDELARACTRQRVFDQDQRLSELLTEPPPTVRPDHSLSEIAATMHAFHCEAVIVLDPSDHLIGLISCRDLIGAIAGVPAALPRNPPFAQTAHSPSNSGEQS